MDVFSSLLSGVGVKADAGGCESAAEDSAWRYIWVAKRRGKVGGVTQWLKGIRPSVSRTASELC